MSWYKTGFEAVAEEQERLEMSRAADVDRWYLKEEQKGQAVFIDDDPFTFMEHQYYKNGDRGVVTCMARVYPERPVCCQKLDAKAVYFIGYFTVLDCTPYQSKKDPNKVYQYGLKLLAAKVGTMTILKRKRDEHISLVNRRCSIFRDKGKTPGAGSEFSFSDEVPADKLPAMFLSASYKGKKLSDLFDEADKDPKAMQKLSTIFTLARDPDGKLVRRIPPFNYERLLAPKKPDELLTFLGGNVTGNYEEAKAQRAGNGGGVTGGNGGGGTTEGAPF